MASFQSLCTLLSTNPSSRISPSPSANPSRRSHRFRVTGSCGGDRKPSADGGRIDRRNMLLRLGGLYGSANLISDPKAFAAPIQPPDFTKCGSAHDNSGTILDINCCPPISDTIVDYKLPPATVLRKRLAVHNLTPSYVEKFEEAIRRMKELDCKDPTDPRGFMQQANIHCAYCNGAHDQADSPDLDLSVHNSWIFFPFHRWYLYFFERIMGSMIDDPTFALPFWNWDNPRGMTFPSIFDKQYSPLYDVNRNPNHRPTCRLTQPIVNLCMRSDESDPLRIISENLSLMYNQMVGGVESATSFMGKPYREKDTVPSGPGTLERGAHTGVHLWVGKTTGSGEDLGNFYSAGRDAVFYCHHANVDRMWAIWTTLKADYPKDITDPDYLGSSFLFYDENKNLVRVKVGDCLDNNKMGYEYEKIDIPWLNSRPTTKTPRAKVLDISKGAPSVDKVTFPTTLEKAVRVIVPKPTKGKADEVLVVEDVETDPTKAIGFDVYVNDEDEVPGQVDKAEYAGTFSQVPHRGHNKRDNGCLKLSLKELYENIDVSDDDTVIVTIVPRLNGQDVTIGGVKIIPAT